MFGWSFFLGYVLASLVVIDNYDSFTYNLVQMFSRYDLTISVFRNDRISLPQAQDLSPDYVLISPGPKDPAHAAVSCDMVEGLCQKTPILGVCLGMQCINEVFGGETIRAQPPMHGKTSAIYHSAEGIFATVPSPFRVARYHSLVISPPTGEAGANLSITAWTQDGVIMGISHRTFPVHGIQFHPESFMTQHGYALIENFLALGPLAESLPSRFRRTPAISNTPDDRIFATTGYSLRKDGRDFGISKPALLCFDKWKN